MKDQYRIYNLNPIRTTASNFETAVEMLTENVYSIALVLQVFTSDPTKVVFEDPDLGEEAKQSDDYFFTPDVITQIENSSRGNSEKTQKPDLSAATRMDSTPETILLTCLSRIMSML